MLAFFLMLPLFWLALVLSSPFLSGSAAWRWLLFLGLCPPGVLGTTKKRHCLISDGVFSHKFINGFSENRIWSCSGGGSSTSRPGINFPSIPLLGIFGFLRGYAGALAARMDTVLRSLLRAPAYMLAPCFSGFLLCFHSLYAVLSLPRQGRRYMGYVYLYSAICFL